MLILPTILMPDRYFLRQTRIELAGADVRANSHIRVHSLVATVYPLTVGGSHCLPTNSG